MNAKVAIIGAGKVGKALQAGITRAGYEVRSVAREGIAEAASWADLVILAVPYAATKEITHQIQPEVVGKTVIDATNPLTPEMQLALGFSTSGAEEIQKLLPGAHVVKAFNTVFAQHMETATVLGRPLSLFAAGNDADSRKAVLELASTLGFDAIDAGPLKSARHLEALACLNIQIGFVQGYGSEIGFQLIH